MASLRGALIGYGFIGAKGHAEGYLRRAAEHGDVEIVAIADSCAGRRALVHEKLPGVAIYPDHKSLLAAEAHRLDFVDIATPPCDHSEIAHAALDRGLHVLCEKPMAPTVAECQSMMDHALSARRVLFPGHNYKHAPVIKAVRKIIADGRIGRVRMVDMNTFRNTHAKGVAEWRPDWRRERAFGGGGIAMDHGSHTFYLAFEWMDAYPTAISARTSTSGKHDTEDTFSCAVTFPTGTATALLTWTAGVRKQIYVINGERGAIRVEDDDIEVSEMVPATDPALSHGGFTWKTERSSVASQWMDASHAGWFGSLFGEFQRAIAAEEFVGPEAREARLCIQLINTAYASAERGCRELRLDDLAASAKRALSIAK